MADSTQNPGELIQQVISFLEKEREIYGDFSSKISSHHTSIENTSEQSSSQSIGNTSDTDSESAKKKDNQTMATSQKSDSFEAQEGLFNKDEANKVYYEIEKCNTLKELEALCKKAEVLQTDLSDTQLVFGVGNPNADLMLIGEAPGAEEDKQGEPFVGKAGQLLNKILSAINFKREEVYIANILKHRPPNNRNPKPEERERSLPFLLRQIDLIEPKLILALGKVATQTLLDSKQSLTKMRGTFHDFRGKYKLMATYHPAALLRHAKWKRPTWEDVQLLRKRYDELGGTP